MNPAEIVVHVVEADRVAVVLQLLREPVREAGEAAHAHPHREVLPLHVGSADVVAGRGSDDRRFPGRAKPGGTVFDGAFPVRAVLPVAVYLHELGEVDPVPERARDSFKVGVVSVRRKLDPVCQPARQVIHEGLGAVAVAASHVPRGNEFCVGTEGNPRPHVAPSLGPLLVARILVLGSHERPDFIALKTLAREVPEGVVLEPGAGVTEIGQQLLNGRAVDARHAHCGAEAVAFDEGGDNVGTLAE